MRLFRDRNEAAHELSRLLAHLTTERPVVLGLASPTNADLVGQTTHTVSLLDAQSASVEFQNATTLTPDEASTNYVLTVELDRSTAVLTVTYDAAKPREFDFAKDRHLSPKDVEEYVGRRLVELARAAQKAHPW